MDLETERAYFRAAVTFLVGQLHFAGGSVIGWYAHSDRSIWLIGQLDAQAEMSLILDEERKKY